MSVTKSERGLFRLFESAASNAAALVNAPAATMAAGETLVSPPAATTSAGPEPISADDLLIKPRDDKKYFTIGGYRILKPYALLGIIFVLVVLLLGYAILA